MEKILILGGDFGTNEKLKKLNFKSSINQSIITTHTLVNSNDSSSKLAVKTICKIYNQPKLRFKSEIFFISEISRRIFASLSLRIRLSVAIFGPYRAVSLSTTLLIFRHIRKLSTAGIIIAFIYGFFRMPKSILIKLMKFRCGDLLELIKLIETLKITKIVILTSGYDYFSFLIHLLGDSLPIEFFMLINNWDNPSSKAIIPKNYKKIGVWNYQQINEIKSISRIDTSKCVVVGSMYADRIYSKYLSNENYESLTLKKELGLLFIGQQNKSDEAKEVLKLNEFITSSVSPYKKIVYRPHPTSRQNQKILKTGKWETENIEINLDTDIDLRIYDAIICFPTTMILEAILSNVPTILYVPRHISYRRDPSNMWKYKHFDFLKKHLPFPIVFSFEELTSLILQGIPKPKKFDEDILRNLLPRFDETYEERILRLIL